MALLKWIQTYAPVFYIKSNQVEKLSLPSEFYQTLKDSITSSKKRVILASLYLGVGKLEKALVDAIDNACLKNSSNKDFRVNILLECTRGSRLTSGQSSRTMLLPLLKSHSSIYVSFFHSPVSWTKWLFGRLNEVFTNLQHMKVYVVDDTVIMSGCNLSQDYFTNRQDRCIVIRDSPELADYFEELVNVVSGVSYILTKSNDLVPSGSAIDPLKGSKTSFITELSSRLKHFLAKQQALSDDRYRQLFDKSSGDRISFDTAVSPLLQVALVGITQDQDLTTAFFDNDELIQPGSCLTIATGYFNLVKTYEDRIIKLASSHPDSSVKMMTSAPKANSFYNGKGFSKYIPTGYTSLALAFLKNISNKALTNISYNEYIRPGWTFHAKGLWLSYPHLPDSPFLTMIGSPNFGYRSVYHDLECQLVLETRSQELSSQLKDEIDHLFKNSHSVDKNTIISDSSRHVPFWVKLLLPFIKKFL